MSGCKIQRGVVYIENRCCCNSLVGLAVDSLLTDGKTGCVVTALEPAGRLGRDGRLAVGDVVLTINNENLRNVTSAQARSIIRRLSLVAPSDVRYVSISFLLFICKDQQESYVGFFPM